MLLPSPLLKHANDSDVRSLVEAWWTEHWMEDHMLGAGRDRDQDRTGLLQQQLYRAQLEAWLLETALKQLKSSKAYIYLEFSSCWWFRNPAECSVSTTSGSSGDDLSKPLEYLNIDREEVLTWPAHIERKKDFLFYFCVGAHVLMYSSMYSWQIELYCLPLELSLSFKGLANGLTQIVAQETHI